MRRDLCNEYDESHFSCMVCLIQNERERTRIETHLEHYLMIMIKRERWMAEECDLVYHNNMHSVITVDWFESMRSHVSVAICALFFICLYALCLFMGKINGVCWIIWNANQLSFYTMGASAVMTNYADHAFVVIKRSTYELFWHAMNNSRYSSQSDHHFS